MHNVFNHLLAALCIADLFFLGGNIVLTPIALGRPDIFNPGTFFSPLHKCQSTNVSLVDQYSCRVDILEKTAFAALTNFFALLFRLIFIEPSGTVESS